MEEKNKSTDNAFYYLTVKQIDDACKKHPYILARFASGHQMGINSKVAAMARQRQRYNDNALTRFVGFTPCDFNNYITHKHPFIVTTSPPPNHYSP